MVLIAARNDAGRIGATVAALKAGLGEWPGSSLWVIADHCTDSTAAEAESSGAQVAVRSGGRSGQGAVIAWWLQRYEAIWQSREAIVIIGADGRLKSGSLSGLKAAIARGGDAAQSLVVPQVAPEARHLAGWSEVSTQCIDDEARWRCDWPVPIRGTGMVFRSRVLAELAPRLHPVTEDLELNLLLAARRIRVEFVREATVYDPPPSPPVETARPGLRRRLQVLFNCRRELLTALTTGGLGNWFLLWPLLLRPRSLFVGARLILLLFVPWLALAGLAMDLVYYLAAAAIVDNPRRYLLDLLAVPRYGGIWLYDWGLAIMRRGAKG